MGVVGAAIGQRFGDAERLAAQALVKAAAQVVVLEHPDRGAMPAVADQAAGGVGGQRRADATTLGLGQHVERIELTM